MNTILAAIDFSPASHNAAVYAASLAKVYNAQLILYNAYQQTIYPAIETPVITPTKELKEKACEQLQDEVAILNRYNQIVAETVCNQNSPAAGILQAARDYKADIIVMGIKGRGKGLRKLMGSTITGLIKRTTMPVIFAPDEAQLGRPDDMAFATDRDADPQADPHILDMLLELAEKFSGRLYMVRTAENQFAEAIEILNRPLRISKMVSALDPVYECIEGKDMAKTLNDFTREHKIDMLALLPHKHLLLERWFIRSTTRSVVFETPIPLLILPDLLFSHQKAINKTRESSL